MSWLTRLRNVFRPGHLAQEIDEEIRFHIEMRAREYAAEGLSAPEAEAQARARLRQCAAAAGEDPRCRRLGRPGHLPAGRAAVVPHAAPQPRLDRGRRGHAGPRDRRQLGGVQRRQRGAPAAAAVPGSGPLFVLFQLHEQADVGRTRTTPLDFLDWQERSRSFAAMAAHTGTGFTLAGDGEPELVIGQLASAELFAVLGVQPLLGRASPP